MLVQGSVSPPTFWLRYIQDGYAVVRLTQNVTSSQNSQGQTVYEYEEIEFQVPDRADLESYVTTNANLYWSQALIDAKQSQISLLAQARDATINGGFKSSADGTARTYPSDPDSADRIHKKTTAMLANVASWPQTWLDASNNWTSFTQAQFQTLITDFNRFDTNQWTQFQILYNDVMAATTVAAVQVIAWTPATY